MERLLCPFSCGCGCQLEHHTEAVNTALECCAVEIAGRIKDQADIGELPVIGVVCEGMQNFLGPASARLGQQLEGDAAAREISHHIARPIAAETSRAIEITGGIEGQAGGGITS